MASYIENMASKMGWDNVLQRGFPQPLDRSSIFGSYTDAQAYASGGNDSRGLSQTSYIGQIITVYENGDVNVYKINESRQLEPISDGKGTLIALTKTEANTLASNEKTIGQMIYCVEEKTVYFVVDKNIMLKMFAIDDKKENLIIDCGTF